MPTHSFLVVDADDDSRLLLGRTLTRKFPGARLLEARDLDTGLRLASGPSADAVIIHRATGIDGPAAVKQLRGQVGSIPIVMVSAVDREGDALAAGADAFILRDEWLRIGVVVAALLNREPSDRSSCDAP